MFKFGVLAPTRDRYRNLRYIRDIFRASGGIEGRPEDEIRKLRRSTCGFPRARARVFVTRSFQTKVNYIHSRRHVSLIRKGREREREKRNARYYRRGRCAAFCHRVRGYKFRDFLGGAISKTRSFLFFAQAGVSFRVYTYFLHLPPPAGRPLFLPQF